MEDNRDYENIIKIFYTIHLAVYLYGTLIIIFHSFNPVWLIYYIVSNFLFSIISMIIFFNLIKLTEFTDNNINHNDKFYRKKDIYITLIVHLFFTLIKVLEMYSFTDYFIDFDKTHTHHDYNFSVDINIKLTYYTFLCVVLLDLWKLMWCAVHYREFYQKQVQNKLPKYYQLNHLYQFIDLGQKV